MYKIGKYNVGGYLMEIVTGVRIDQIVSKLTYQLVAKLRNDDMIPDVIFDSAIEIILLWLREKAVSQSPHFS